MAIVTYEGLASNERLPNGGAGPAFNVTLSYNDITLKIVSIDAVNETDNDHPVSIGGNAHIVSHHSNPSIPIAGDNVFMVATVVRGNRPPGLLA